MLLLNRLENLSDMIWHLRSTDWWYISYLELRILVMKVIVHGLYLKH